MTNTNTDATDDAADEQTLTEFHRDAGPTPLRTRNEEILAHLHDSTSMREVVITFAAGVVLGVLVAGWIIQSITISTTGAPDMLVRVALGALGGVSILGTKMLSALVTGYILVAMGVTVDHPL